jgi:IclR family pca regulon transcriptional regulator
MHSANSPESSAFEASRDYVQSLARGLAVLQAFNAHYQQMNLSQVATRVGLTRAAARRLLLTLQHLGYIRAEGRLFFLSPKVLELGYSYLDTLNLTDITQPLVEEVSRQLNESCSLAVLDHHNIVYVVRVPVRRIMTVSLGVGASLPAYCASLGRVLLSQLSESELKTWLTECKLLKLTPHTLHTKEKIRGAIEHARKQGYAYVEQELEMGLCSLAVPICNAQGRIIAALNVSTTYRPDVAHYAKQKLLPALLKAAKSIEKSINRSGIKAP